MSLYERIYDVVRSIPRGKVASYGQVAKTAGRCSARNVGYAMAALKFDSDVPWHRVINGQGRVSPRKFGDGSHVQRQMLETEGIVFDNRERVDFSKVGWQGLENS
ncbi:MAG: methylated-DNA--[protein]-cysteine S-methyltransferase [Proteobacteria bacterium]|nr:methylated-DNA--[protein]-cysteine S-methyltransferase [Pseudomonadota bacterium]